MTQRTRTERDTRVATIACAALVLQSAITLAFLRAFLVRPLAFDEQWRAYWVSLGSEAIPHIEEAPAPMTAGWLGLQNAGVALLGNSELAMRLPMILALPALAIVCYFVARRFIGHLGGWAVGALVLLNGPVIVYGILMKQFVFEALFGVLALAIWYWGHDEPSRAPRPQGRVGTDRVRDRRGTTNRLPIAFALMALCTFFSASSLFVVLPLLAIDGWRCVRNKSVSSTVVGLGIALVLIGAHLQFWFLRQAKLAGDTYWRPFYVPHQPAAAWELISAQLQTASKIGTAVYLPPDTTDRYLFGSTPPPPASAVVWLVALTFLGCLAWGVVRAAQRPTARPLLLVIGAAVVFQLGASWFEKWPFGLVRTNIVMVPLLYLVAAIGAADLIRQAWRTIGQLRAGERGPDLARLAVLVGASVVVLIVAVVVPATAVSNVRSFDERYSAPVFVDRIRDAVRVVRREAGPNDIVIEILDNFGWAYYAWDYDDPVLEGSGIARVPEERTLQAGDYLAPSINEFVDQHRDAGRVFVFDFMDVTPEAYDQQARWMAQRGRCPTRRWDFEQTGIVTEYETSPTAPDCGDPVRQPVEPLAP